jgi:two-component system sensor histidine kinase VicK
MIAVERKIPQPFNNEQKNLLEMIADYATILIDNFSRFQNLEKQLFHIQQSGIYSKIDSDLKNDLLFQAGVELHNRLNHLKENLDYLLNPGDRKLSTKQTEALDAIQKEADILINIADSMVFISQAEKNSKLEKTDLNKIIRDVVNRYQIIAQVYRIIIKLDLPIQPTIVTVFTSQIIKVIEGLLSNALKHSPPKTQITIRVEQKDDWAIFSVKDLGDGIDENFIENLFEKKSSQNKDEVQRFGGIGISLPMMKEIMSAHRGKIWVDSGNGKGFIIYFSLPQ